MRPCHATGAARHADGLRDAPGRQHCAGGRRAAGDLLRSRQRGFTCSVPEARRTLVGRGATVVKQHTVYFTSNYHHACDARQDALQAIQPPVRARQRSSGKLCRATLQHSMAHRLARTNSQPGAECWLRALPPRALPFLRPSPDAGWPHPARHHVLNAEGHQVAAAPAPAALRPACRWPRPARRARTGCAAAAAPAARPCPV